MNNLSKREGLFFKAKSLISYLYGVVLWTSSTTLPPYPMHNPKNSHGDQLSNIIHPSLLGLKTLIYHSQLPKHPNPHHQYQNPNPSSVIHSHMIISSSRRRTPSGSSSQPPSLLFHSNSILFGDLIGTDSGVHLNFDIINVHQEDQVSDGLATSKYCEKSVETMMSKRRDKLYPPPIPLLARTGNLPGHMPWILTRHYENGKLILTEERVKHHEYFEAEREDGRLILNLVSLDNMVTNCYHNNGARDEQQKEIIDDLDFLDDDDDRDGVDFIQETDGDDDDDYGFDEKEEDDIWGGSSVPKSKSNGSWLLCGEVRKCLTYAGRTTMSSILSDINDVSNSVNACSNIAQLASNPFAFVVPSGTATVCGVV